ncbi:MAG TPA: hypothetical protein VJS92_12430 [Candidatus Polarisedimenticolaceae bacterium]|nr:hypothetical protein [Candidatus Polarisedimenticolaceae bacterium]
MKHGPALPVSLSATLTGVYVVAALFVIGPLAAFELALVLIGPTLCVWYPEVVARHAAFGLVAGGVQIVRPSPPWLVATTGWCLLAMPLVFGLIAWGNGELFRA